MNLDELAALAAQRRLWWWGGPGRPRSRRVFRWRRKLVVNDVMAVNRITQVGDLDWDSSVGVIAWSDPNALLRASILEIRMAEAAARARYERKVREKSTLDIRD